MEENKQMFDLGEPWEELSEAASTMSAEDFKKYAMDNFEWKGNLRNDDAPGEEMTTNDLDQARTMDGVEWSDEEHHLVEATATWMDGAAPTNVIMLSKTLGAISAWNPVTSSVQALSGEILIPTGRKFKLTPLQDLPRMVWSAEQDLVTTSDAVDDLAHAIRLTVEYVGNDMLPPVEGWSWFDALKKYRPDLLKEFIDIEPTKEPRKGWGHIPVGYDEHNAVFED